MRSSPPVPLAVAVERVAGEVEDRCRAADQEPVLRRLQRDHAVVVRHRRAGSRQIGHRARQCQDIVATHRDAARRLEGAIHSRAHELEVRRVGDVVRIAVAGRIGHRFVEGDDDLGDRSHQRLAGRQHSVGGVGHGLDRNRPRRRRLDDVGPGGSDGAPVAGVVAGAEVEVPGAVFEGGAGRRKLGLLDVLDLVAGSRGAVVEEERVAVDSAQVVARRRPRHVDRAVGVEERRQLMAGGEDRHRIPRHRRIDEERTEMLGQRAVPRQVAGAQVEVVRSPVRQRRAGRAVDRRRGLRYLDRVIGVGQRQIVEDDRVAGEAAATRVVLGARPEECPPSGRSRTRSRCGWCS